MPSAKIVVVLLLLQELRAHTRNRDLEAKAIDQQEDQRQIDFLTGLRDLEQLQEVLLGRVGHCWSALSVGCGLE